MEKINSVYLSLGSNVGDREYYLENAINNITKISQTRFLCQSRIYETVPVGYLDQDLFLNVVIKIETELSPIELLEKILEIETSLERKRLIRWGPRTIDIDILLFGSEEITDERLTVPHPRMFERAFVIVPLKEILQKNEKEISKWFLEEIASMKDTEGIKVFEPTSKIGRECLFLDEVTSTNDYVKELALNGAVSGLVVVAKRQTAGRGRLGKKWNSESEDGIWLSILIRPTENIENINDITRIFAVSVVKTLYAVCDVKSVIKWPNDIIVDNRKVSGILCESHFEGDKCKFIVVGIGINLLQNSFDGELQQRAISLKMHTNKSFDKLAIINGFVKISNTVYDDYTTDKTSFNNFYKKNCVTLGKQIKIVKDKEEIVCKAIDIDESGNLIVEYADKSIDEISSGEVSVRGLYNYV